MKRTLLTTALAVTALFGVAHAQSIDAIAAKGVKAPVAHPQTTCWQPCGASGGLVNPVGFGGPVQVAWSNVDPVYGKFHGISHWQGQHQCPAANGGPWVEQQAVNDVWLMYSDHIDPVHGSCRLLVSGVSIDGGLATCHSYIMLNGQVRLNDCVAQFSMDPIQFEEDPKACPGILSRGAGDEIVINWQSWGINTTANQSLTWVENDWTFPFSGGSPAMVQLR